MDTYLDLAFYNPDQLKDDDFLRGFVARRELAGKILARLAEITPTNLARHRLILGQRGMGKTSLLRRIAIGVRDTPALAAVLLPLRFREEQYNVHSLHVFWCNCLDALGDWLEASGRPDEADRLDREVAALAGRGDDREGEAALALFKEWLKRENRRPLLLLDNIDLIFDGLKGQQWSLRRTLQEAGGVVVIGTSAVFLEATIMPEAPFYDFFQVDYLERLSREELFSSLRQLAEARGEPGKKVATMLARDPGRIHTLYDLTGGNPRTLVMLYLMLEMSDQADLMRDLERLLDQATPLYKARVEDLAPQARVVFDVVALAWNPITAAEVAVAASLDTPTVSTQLDRLGKDGILEKVHLSTTKRAGFQLSERFFNIWYLMRHASRRQRSRLRWLTEFLRKFYSPRELADVADRYLVRTRRDSQSDALMCLAIADAIDDASHRQALNHHATLLLEDYSRQTRKKIEEIIDLAELHPTTHDMEELKQKVVNCDGDWGNIDPAQFWDLLGGSISMSRSEKGGIVNELPQLKQKKLQDLMQIFAADQQYLSRYGNDEAQEGLRRALREGLMESLDDFHGALAAVRYYRLPALLVIAAGFGGPSWQIDTDQAREELNRQVDKLLQKRETDVTIGASLFYNILGNLLVKHLGRYAEAEEAYRKAIELDSKDAYPWNNLGNLLQNHLGRYEEAERAYRKAIELDPQFAYPWNGLGNLLVNHLGRYEEAEGAYLRAIELAPPNATPWNGLGTLLVNFGRYEEAEGAYRKAIELDPKFAKPWDSLGILLMEHLGRFEEAEVAFRMAIKLDPKNAYPWNNLGALLQEHLGRYEEAEGAYRKAIELDPKEAYPWNNLGNLLKGYLGRYEEAEGAYRKAIELDPKDAYPWNGLGILLQDYLGRYEEAEAAYRKAMKLAPKFAYPWHGLGILLMNYLGRYEEAEGAYRKAIELDPKFASSWNSLGNLLIDHLGRHAEAEGAYRKSLELAPNYSYPLGNLAYLLLAQQGREEEAESCCEQAVGKYPAHGAGLLRAFFALTRDNFGQATQVLGQVLEEGHPELLTVYRDDLLRVLRLAAQRGYGDKLFAWLDETGLGDRYWPIRAAFDAYLHGAELLGDVNPEVRGAASRIYSWLAGQRTNISGNSRAGKPRRKSGKRT